MTWIDWVFFFYIFVGLYMTSLMIFIYFPNRKRIFGYEPGVAEPVSIVMPCYNESKTIGAAIESLLKLNYPNDMIEIIVVDDQSKDNSAEIVRRYAQKYSNVRLIVNERNSGGAAEPTNIGIKAAKYDYIAVADADSTPEPDALIKMIGFLQKDSSVGGVTCAVVARHPSRFFQKIQALEYAMIAWTRKLLDFVDAVYVTPGPFALYRKDVLFKVGLFDIKNLTQDIEIVWRMRLHGYRARMCLATRVASETPERFKQWWKQRVRWNIGGTQTLLKYKRYVFRKGMLGAFIIPYFSFSLFIGLIGLGMYFYLISRRVLIWTLSTKYSIYGSATLVRLNELSFAPSLLNIFGGLLFLLGIFFTFFGLGVMREKRTGFRNILNIMFYMIVYLVIYPFIMITGLYKLARGSYSWGK